jgi:aryl-alcohol dehydrogenase-like predicted oxidoreductase
MQFGSGMNVGNLDQKATSNMIDFAIDHGINLIDTADVYSRGQSETLVGEAIKGKRSELVVATKVRLPMSDDNFNRSGPSRVNIIRGVESSLRRLQTDYIDLYQVHGWDSNTPLEETLRTLDDLVRQAKSAISASVTSWRGKAPRHWRSRSRNTSSPLSPPKCITVWSAATWSTISSPSPSTTALASSCGALWPAVS